MVQSIPDTDDKAALAAWLRAEREKRGWSRLEMARRLRSAAQAIDDRSVPGLESVQHNIYRWERGVDGISERYWLLYRSALDIAPPTLDSAATGTDDPSVITLTITIELPSPGHSAISVSTEEGM